MKLQPALLPAAFLVLLLSAAVSRQSGDVLVIDESLHHLGDDETSDWTDVPLQPEGDRLELAFPARPNEVEWTLRYSQRHVDDPWRLSINGALLRELKRTPEAREEFVAVPAGLLRDANTLSLEGDVPTDDIVFGNLRLAPRPLREELGLTSITVRVNAGGEPSPARITVADEEGGLVPLYFAEGLHRAVREGVVYTDEGVARFDVPRSAARVYATRGPEWSLAQAGLDGRTEIVLAIERVVDTTGFVACDTHVHTLTFSGHGDSSVEERMVTLAGEGVELAISTDHNHNTDYRPYQDRMQLGRFFKPVVGNEVTTPIGHFNAFPLDPDEEVPPYELRDVVQVVDGIRAKGAQVVILNHPRWPSHAEGPFGVIGLDHATGGNRGEWTYPFDAVELINSTTEEEEPMLLFRDWFALLNRGTPVTAVGSSDSHTVGDPVGGGRTYVASATDDPAGIDVDAACRAIVEGRTSLSMGIFLLANARSGGAADPGGSGATGGAGATMGEVLSVSGGTCTITATVRAPRWVQPERAMLYVNGELRFEASLLEPYRALRGDETASGCEVELSHTLDGLPAQDAWAVWVVVGEGVDGPYWPVLNDYTLAATNPIFLDLDGDGAYRSPRDTAEALLSTVGDDLVAFRRAAAESWEAVAVHALDGVRRGLEERARHQLRDVASALREAHPGVGAYLEGLPAIR